MNRTVAFLAAASATAIVLALVWSYGVERGDVHPDAPPSTVASEGPTSTEAGADGGAGAAGGGAAGHAPDAWLRAAQPLLATLGEVPVRPGQVLATVNGVALTPADLGIAEARAVGASRYAFLLDRAVGHEVARQAAAAEGITVTDGPTTDAAPASPEAAEFARREIETGRLEQALADRRGLPGPRVTRDQVEEHYAANVGQYGELPSEPAARAAAWKEVDLAIRQDLAPEVAARNAVAMDDLRQALRDAAAIEVSAPTL